MPRRKKELDIPEIIEENIVSTEYSDVMAKSYINYAMSVIVDRALPDIRDGLKPVQRRILYDMSELGVTHDKPYKKVARIVGDTMGKYHPHGDSSISGALVTMAQDFKQGVPLIDGHGNFGSIEGDGAAASRYIEAKLHKFTEDAFLSDLKNDTVDFVPNYDETEKEPAVLPAKLPNFLINGAEGIAVGMATYVPPHNVGDVIDTALYYMKHPKAKVSDLLEILHGPDFPTGGIISNKSELLAMYENGEGKIKVRGKIKVEKDKDKLKLVITEIPYTMIGDGIDKFLQSVASLVEDRTLSDITDISNQSSKEGIRIVFDLKKGADTQYIENVLYKKTRFEDTFGLNMLAVRDGKPAVLSLKDVYDAYLDFQREINTRKYRKLRADAERRKEINEGLIKAVGMIDLIIAVLRGSRNAKDAKNCLMTGTVDGISFATDKLKKQAMKLNFTEAQAQAILDMRLQRLIGLEIENIQKELDSIIKDLNRYNKILSSPAELSKVIIAELEQLKKNYATSRKTEIIDAKEVTVVLPEEKEVPVAVIIDSFGGYIRCVDKSIFDKNYENDHEGIKFAVQTTSKSKVQIIDSNGNVHNIKVSDIPNCKWKDKGKVIDAVSEFKWAKDTPLCALDVCQTPYVVYVTKRGRVKKSKEDVLGRKKASIYRAGQNDELVAAFPYASDKDLIVYSNLGKAIKIKNKDIPEFGSKVAGNMFITYGTKEYAVKAEFVSPDSTIVVDGVEKTVSSIKAYSPKGKKDTDSEIKRGTKK